MDGIVIRVVAAAFLLALLGAASCGDEQGSATRPPLARVAPEQVAEADRLGIPVRFENDLGMRFVLIPAGTFPAEPLEDKERRIDADIQHRVTLQKGFYMQTAEVTMGQFRQFRPHDPEALWGETGPSRLGRHWDDSRPVTHVHWHDAVEFARWLSERDQARVYELPEEYQWLFACRAGTTAAYWNGSTIGVDEANFDWRDTARYGDAAEADTATTVAGSYPANAWGLYDMLGNVSEWCQDEYRPKWGGRSEHGPKHVVRGGGWLSSPPHVGREGRRSGHASSGTGRPMSVGFRLVSPLPESTK